MKKYLFFLAFILPFMAIGQFKMSAADKKTFDSLVHAPLTLAPSHTNCFSKDSNYLKAEWVDDQMPTTDGDKDGVIKVTMHPTNITFDSKGRVDSVYYEKDSTIKGTITGTDTTKPCDRCWPKIDTTKHVSENMPTIDGNKDGILNSPLWWEPDTTTLIKLATKGNHKHVGRGKKHSAKIVKGKHDHTGDESFLVTTYPLAPDAQLPLATFGPTVVLNDAMPLTLLTKPAMPTKDSVVKGWIVYYKKGLVTKQWTTMCYSTLNGHYPIKVSSTKQGVEQVIREAAEHYHEVMVEEATQRFGCEGCYTLLNANDGMTSYHKVLRMQFYKIEVDGKPFNLNKYYQFIPENQVVE